jgi:hypothetical protein
MSETKKRVVVRDDGPQTGTDTVTIGCKWPNGIVMRLYDFEEVEIMVNGRVFKENISIANPDYPEFTLNGFSIDRNPMAERPEYAIIGGFGLTHGIPRDFAEAWFKQNAQSELVKQGLVFMEGTEQRARAQAKEYRPLQSGVQPIDPNDPGPRAGLKKGSIKKETAGNTSAD